MLVQGESGQPVLSKEALTGKSRAAGVKLLHR